LIVALLITLIAISVIFVNWYAALTALGVGSVIIGLAVQTPMKSFIGWIYILVRAAVSRRRPHQNQRRYRRRDRR
jgi:small-conductance mechanosensitive channel